MHDIVFTFSYRVINTYRGLELLRKKKDTDQEIMIADQEEKIKRLKSSIDSYKKQLTQFNLFKKEREIFHSLSIVFSTAKSFEELFRKTMDVLSQHLKARYYGVFWLNKEDDTLEYRYGKGYKAGFMPGIPRLGSLMGDSLFNHDILWKQDVKKLFDYIPLNQEPSEYNILCAPIVLFGKDAGVIRLANIDEYSQDVGKKILRTVTPLICASLEKMQLQEQNIQTLKGLEAGFAIASLLENTVSENDILQKVCTQVSRLFPCKACVIAIKLENGIKPVYSWPDKFCFTGNSNSSLIYIKNLFEAFPDGNALVENIHRDRRWAWPAQDIKSLCMVAIHMRGVLRGALIVLGPKEEVYTKAHQNLLGLVVAQMSVTMERASYIRKQEEMASHDGLTGLLNHRMFQDNIRVEMERAKRYNRPLSLVMFDIDHFKLFNDTHGHPIGDEVIKMVSRTIKGMVRKTDRAYRYGGEEFCALLPETKAENGIHFAERLRKKIEINKSVKNLSVTISVGITQYKTGELAESFVDRVDTILYKSKEDGRNRVSVG